jgi:AcrR family transcriptional regulator
MGNMDWIPTQGSAKTKLIQAAMEEFSLYGFEGVNVVELTHKVGVTTGTLYHHFGSKVGLYNTIREELERRVMDRMHGAASVFSTQPTKAITAAVLIGFDTAVQMNACVILSEPPRSVDADLILDLLQELCQTEAPNLGSVLLAAWRAALKLVASGLDVMEARRTLEWLLP